MVYLVSLPNKNQPGEPKFLRSDDSALIARWIKAEDRPGFGIYSCRNPLKPGAARHGRDSTDAIEELAWDVDFKDLAETAEQVDEKLAQVLLPFSEIVDSGHGRYPSYRLKERILHSDPDYERVCNIHAKLIEYFGADPQVRPWSLTRHPGTTNSKEEPHVPCRVLHTGGAPVDLTELEELCELVEGAPLLTRTPRTTNGHDHAEGEPRLGPVDVPAELATIMDGASANRVQCRVIASLLRKGEHPDDVLKLVVDATLARVSGWTRDVEVAVVTERIKSAYNNLLLKGYDPSTGVIPDWLPGEFHAAWIERLQAGRRPKVCHANHIGWHIRSRADAKEEPPTGGSPKDEKAKPNCRFKLVPFADLHLGSDPLYLVDELIPIRGLVDV